VISGLRNNGIEIAGANSNIVQGNYIGTDASGMVRSTTVSNGVGIFFANNNTVGGTTNTTLGGACTGACNVISGTAITA
jgi:titin